MAAGARVLDAGVTCAAVDDMADIGGGGGGGDAADVATFSPELSMVGAGACWPPPEGASSFESHAVFAAASLVA